MNKVKLTSNALNFNLPTVDTEFVRHDDLACHIKETHVWCSKKKKKP